MLSLQPVAPSHHLPAPAGPTAPPVERSPVALRLVMLVALYSLPLLVALRPVAAPVYDPDVWWHLRVGQWAVDHGAVPETDPFAQTHRPWVAYSWLYEVLLFALWSRLGLFGIVLYRAALSLAVLAAVHRLVARRETRFLAATGLTAAAGLALAMLFSERPWLFTVLFATLTLDVVLDLRAGRRSLLFWLLPLAFAVWANVHIQFVYGLFVLGLACAAPLVDGALGRSPGETAATARSRGWWALVGLSAACALATLCNPYHARLYFVVLEYATQPGPFRFVNELKAPEFREPSEWVMLALGGAACFALGRRKSLSAFDLVLLAAAAFFAFRARRDLWFLVLASLAVLARPGAQPRPGEALALTPGRLAAVLAGVLAVGLVLAFARGLSPGNLAATVEGKFPVKAAAAVRARGHAGPLYNDFNWGGYLIWALPDMPVAIDGRTNLHGDERIERFGRTWSGGPGWEDDPDLASAGVVIAPADSPLASLLARDGRFALDYEDEVARVYVARKKRGR